MNGLVIDMEMGLLHRTIFRARLSHGFIVMVAVASILFAVTGARADCGGAFTGIGHKAGAKPTAFILGSPLARVQDWDFHHADATIVGLWRFKAVSKGNPGIPDGAVLDQGLSVWHNDGTEIMNSGRDPVTGSFCLGAWKQTGLRSYKLSHYAMAWTGLTYDAKGNVIEDPTTKQPLNTLVGFANIREDVTLDPGKDTFAGAYSLDQYDTTGISKVHLNGEISAYRVTADSPAYIQ